MNNLPFCHFKKSILAIAICIGLQNHAAAQQMDAAVYKRAEQFLPANTAPLIKDVIQTMQWKDDTLYYSFAPHSKRQPVRVVAGKRPVKKTGGFQFPAVVNSNAGLSPDGKKVAFIRDHNLWIRTIPEGEEVQLTFDGQEDYGYATNNAGWITSDQPVMLWSPQSDKIATFQHDGRGIKEMVLVHTNEGHPEVQRWKYPFAGDSTIFKIERVVIHVSPNPSVVRLKMPADPQRSSITDHIADRSGNFLDVQWSPDGKELAFLSNSRDHKEAVLKIADPFSGDVRTVFSERENTFFESGFSTPSWRFLPDTREAIWYSQRSDQAHLYLYDLATGKLKHQITSGNWRVLDVLRVDEKTRHIYFSGSGREPGDPYYQYVYRVDFDGKNLVLLTPELGTHDVTFSPSGKYFTDTWSTPQEAPITVLRNKDGRQLLALEKGDITSLKEAGWKPPMSFTVKARDGKTDLYGLLYTPSDMDSSKTYPVVNYLYPGPQTGSVGSRRFMPSRGDKQAMAELGFIVAEVDAFGTPGRSKSFHEYYYGNMGDNGLPDQIGMIHQLAANYSWMDTSRVGIWGHSGGGFASTRAIFQYPDFYKVAVSSAGNHDNRSYEDDWAEKWQGLLVRNPDGTTNYDNQANQYLAKNLKGKLLLAHGTLDNNVPPVNTLLVVDALIAANKNFDLLLLPNRRHGFAYEPYMMRRRWDYFVRHLLGKEPPSEYDFSK